VLLLLPLLLLLLVLFVQALIMFVSESGICRGPLAAAAFAQLLQHSPLRDCLQVTMRVGVV
jgi:hypothetical protein